MTTTELDNTAVATHLGKVSKYKSEYDNTLLVGEPRQNNRKYLAIADDNLPFVGYDIWNGWEISCLTNNGLPASGIARIVYPANSPNIVESKSMKLYWNSYNMTKMGPFEREAYWNMQKSAVQDRARIIKVPEEQVKVSVYNGNRECNNFYSEDNYRELLRRDQYRTLEDHVIFDKDITVYNETPSLLELDTFLNGKEERCFYHSSLLRSNCRVTFQPDHGDIFIYWKGTTHVSPESLLAYIVSFRNECHFHEEVIECVYKRLFDILNPQELKVEGFYVRRGGWDINAIRASHEYLIPTDQRIAETSWLKTLRQ
jgi:7-cyano-7-deazaguanine reductase